MARYTNEREFAQVVALIEDRLTHAGLRRQTAEVRSGRKIGAPDRGCLRRRALAQREISALGQGRMRPDLDGTAAVVVESGDVRADDLALRKEALLVRVNLCRHGGVGATEVAAITSLCNESAGRVVAASPSRGGPAILIPIVVPEPSPARPRNAVGVHRARLPVLCPASIGVFVARLVSTVPAAADTAAILASVPLAAK